MYTRVKTLLLGDLLLSPVALSKTLIERSGENPQEIGIGRIGPYYGGTNVALIHPTKMPPEKVKKVLEEFMNLDEPDSRRPLTLFSKAIGAPFLLGMTGKEAKALRSTVVHHLRPSQFFAQSTAQITNLLEEKARNPFDSTPLDETIQNYVFSIICNEIFGIKETPLGTRETLHGIESIASKTHFMLFPILFKLSNHVRKVKQQYSAYVKQFYAAEQTAESKDESLLGTYMAKSTKANKMDDPDLRASPAFLIAANNITAVITLCMEMLMLNSDRLDPLRKEMNAEFKEHDEIGHEVFDKKKFPALHHIYLESLRIIGSRAQQLVRYTKTAIQTENLTVPANTLIIFNLKQVFDNPNYFANPQDFTPDRFKEETPVNALITFGTGKRVCAGFKVSEVIFKTFIAHYVKHNLIAHKLFLRNYLGNPCSKVKLIWANETQHQFMKKHFQSEKYIYRFYDGELHFYQHNQNIHPFSGHRLNFKIGWEGGRTHEGWTIINFPSYIDDKTIARIESLRANIYLVLHHLFPLAVENNIYQIEVTDIDARLQRIHNYSKENPSDERPVSASIQRDLYHLLSAQISLLIPQEDCDLSETVRRYGEVANQICDVLASNNLPTTASITNVSTSSHYLNHSKTLECIEDKKITDILTNEVLNRKTKQPVMKVMMEEFDATAPSGRTVFLMHNESVVKPPQRKSKCHWMTNLVSSFFNKKPANGPIQERLDPNNKLHLN